MHSVYTSDGIETEDTQWEYANEAVWLKSDNLIFETRITIIYYQNLIAAKKWG